MVEMKKGEHPQAEAPKAQAPKAQVLHAQEGVPFSRLLLVELRKMVDTRAGFWLIGILVFLSFAAVLAIGLLSSDRSFGAFSQFVVIPQSVLLPVLGILLITSEWGQRTALTTFTLIPSRSKVVAAKVVAAFVLVQGAYVVAIGFAALATVFFGRGADAWEVPGRIYFYVFIYLSLVIFGGLAFGMLFLNSAVAIVLYNILPFLVATLSGLSARIAENSPWFSLVAATQNFFTLSPMGGTQWAQLAVSATIWVVIPFTVGWWRIMRAEIK